MELEHEYPYQSKTQRQLNRKVSTGKSYFGVSISKDKGLTVEGYDAEGNVTGEASFNSDRFTMRAKDDAGQMVDCIVFDPQTRMYHITGRTIIDGSLYADSLYADAGNIAELTVDWLDTSHKISKYLLNDTTDDNHLTANLQSLKFISSVVRIGEDGTPLTTQLQDRYGRALYWMADISSAQIGNGYPEIDGDRVTTTTETTDWPVIVYQYTDAVKREISFGEDGVPIDIFGLGYGGEGMEGKGQIEKTPTSFEFRFTGADGTDRGVYVTDSHTEIKGLRASTKFDFSTWDEGYYTEELDDGTTQAFQVDFDSDGKPINISDGTRNVEVVW